MNESLPPPTQEQQQTMLFDKEIEISSEIISAAYEPRFKLFALGTAIGELFVINDKNYCFSYIPNSPESPILKIVPLINSSSFLSLCSFSLYTNHCMNTSRQERPKVNSDIFFKKNSILSDKKPEIFSSTIIHWVVADDGFIIPRVKTIKYDVIDFAVSSVHPEFALLLTKTGSIYGFSVEEMKFTDLYINQFEGKNVHSIYCPLETNFFICHDFIEKLNIVEKEVSEAFKIEAMQIDMLDEKKNSIAVIDYKQKKPSLFKGNKQEKTFDLPSDSRGICVSMINEKEWTSIVHSKSADSIYLKKKMKINLDGEILVPSICIEYKNGIERDEAKNVTFVTNTGRFVNLNGNSTDHFMLNPIDPTSAFIDKNDNIYVFDSHKKCQVFEKCNYMGAFTFDWGEILAVLNGFALCLSEEGELFIANIKNNQKVNLDSPLVSSPVVSYQSFEEYIDVLCIDRKVVRFNLSSKEVFEGFEVTDNEELKICLNYPLNRNNQFWRPFLGTFACIKNISSVPVLIVDKLVYNEVCESNEKVLLFDVIDESGKVTPKSARYILIVTTFHISIYDIDSKGIKRIRHVSLSSSDPIIESSITSWGILIVRTKESIKLMILPDPSYDPVAKLSLTYNAPPPLSNDENIKAINPIILPHKGLIVFERNLVTIYLKEIKTPFCFDANKMPDVLVPPQAGGFKKIFGKKGSMSIDEADRCYLFNRVQSHNVDANSNNNDASSTASSIASSLSETQELMQQILVKANERSDQLNELEIKAQRLLESAKQYHKACRQFRH